MEFGGMDKIAKNCTIVFIILLQVTMVISLKDVHSATIQFDIQDTDKAIGRLDCQNDIIDIVSIEYYSNSQHCDRIVCPKAPAANYSYFDGRNIVCSNEDNIRLRCSGEQSCEFGPEGVLAIKPSDGCFTLTQIMTSTSMRIMHRCIPQDNYRDICDKNYVSYPAGTTPVIATTKVTRQNQRSCKCVIVTSNSLAYMLLNVVRMGALYDGDNITFYLHGAGFPYSTNYSKNYLLPSKNYTATSNQTPTIRLVSPTRNIEGRSRVFIRVVHDADIIIKCNDATNETHTSVTTPVSTESTSSLPIAVTAGVTSEGTTSGDGASSMMITVIIALSVTLSILLIGLVIGLTIFCLRKRRRRNRPPTSYSEVPMLPSKTMLQNSRNHHADNNNQRPFISYPLTPDVVLSAQGGHAYLRAPAEAPEEVGGVYHELEDEEEDDYAEIPADVEYAGKDYAFASQPEETDPYKVTLLSAQGQGHYDPRLSPPTDYNGYSSPGASAPQIRNSRGSIDAHTENSYSDPTAVSDDRGEDHYSMPCDVIKVEELPPSSDSAAAADNRNVEYDIPPETYAALNKPPQYNPTVDLIDNELYEDEKKPSGSNS